MNEGELREVHMVARAVEALRQDFSDYREESREHRELIRKQLDDHAGSDQRNFAEIFKRLRPLEILAGVQTHGHTWRVALASALAGAAGLAGLEFLLRGMHP